MFAFTRSPDKAGGEASRAASRKALPIPPPKVEPLILRALPPEQAVAVNAAIPLASSPGPAAKPLSIVSSSPAFDNALDCLTAAIYYEAATQSVEGQRAVAQVVCDTPFIPLPSAPWCSKGPSAQPAVNSHSPATVRCSGARSQACGPAFAGLQKRR
jgi:hypothetical protein